MQNVQNKRTPGEISSAGKMVRNVGIVGGATILSRVLGFIRDSVIALVLGAGPLADAFFVAFRLPTLLYTAFGEGPLSLALVSQHSKLREQEGDYRGQEFFCSLLVWICCLVGGLCLVVLLGASPLTACIVPGFVGESELFAHTVLLVRVCFPYLLFACAVGVCAGVLNSYGCFLGPALASSVLNIGLIAGGLLAWSLGLPVPETLGVALLVAGGMQLLLQVFFLRRQGVGWVSSWNFADPAIKEAKKLFGGSILSVCAFPVSLFVVTLLASFLGDGRISWLNYSSRLILFPLGIFGITVGVVVLPDLATLYSTRNYERFFSLTNRSLQLLFCISLPASAGLAAMAYPIIDVLLGRGAFGAEDVQGTALALQAYSVGLPALAMVRPLLSAFYARQAIRAAVISSLGSIVFTAIGGVVLLGPLEHVGLALSVSLGAWGNCLLLLYAHQKAARMHSQPSLFFLWSCWRWPVFYVAASCVVFGVASFAAQAWGAWSLCTIPVIAGSYVFCVVLSGSPEVRLLMRVKKSS